MRIDGRAGLHGSGTKKRIHKSAQDYSLLLQLHLRKDWAHHRKHQQREIERRRQGKKEDIRDSLQCGTFADQ